MNNLVAFLWRQSYDRTNLQQILRGHFFKGVSIFDNQKFMDYFSGIVANG